MEEWVSVLALSDEWEFQIVRDLAIQELSSHKQNSANMITLGVKYSVPLWFIRGCYDFIYRAEGPQPDEIKMIGLERALSIYELRKMDLQGHMYHPIGEIKKIFGEVANCDITDSNNWMSTTSEEAVSIESSFFMCSNYMVNHMVHMYSGHPRLYGTLTLIHLCRRGS